MAEEPIGKVSHYFSHVGVAAIVLTGALKVGDTVRVHGNTTDFTTEVKSMQIDRKEIEAAKTGDDIGILVPEKVREGDEVFLVEG